MALLDYIEMSASWLLKNQRGHGDKAFTKRQAFTDLQGPTITVTSPDCGPSDGTLQPKYTQIGEDRLPELEWTCKGGTKTVPPAEVKQFLVIIEDVDAPIPTPALHGLFVCIPATKSSLTDADIKLPTDSKSLADHTLAGGFKYVKNIRRKHYAGPRPLLAHGPHKYIYQVVALKEELDPTTIGPQTTRDTVASSIVGKVWGYGVWAASFERSSA